MLAIIALVVAAIVALTVLGFALHILFSPWLLVVIAIVAGSSSGQPLPPVTGESVHREGMARLGLAARCGSARGGRAGLAEVRINRLKEGALYAVAVVEGLGGSA